MPYEGPGIYQHYKGGYYAVRGVGLQENTVVKPGQPEHAGAGPEIHMVVYEPLSSGSLLEEREGLDFWLRNIDDFNENVDGPEVNIGGPERVPRFRKISFNEVMRLRNERKEEWLRWKALVEEGVFDG